MRPAATPIRPGFTLLEILVVVALIAVIAALATPSIEGMYGNVRMTASIDQVRGQWAEARSHAIDNGQSYRFAVMMGQNKFRVAPDLPEFWSGGGGSGQLEEGVAYVHEDQLQKGVAFTAGSSPSGGGGEWHTVVTFLPNGECKEDAEVTLGGDGYAPHTVRIRGLTGVISVTKQTPGGR